MILFGVKNEFIWGKKDPIDFIWGTEKFLPIIIIVFTIQFQPKTVLI